MLVNIKVSLQQFEVIASERSNLDVASDEKRDCRALWARNDNLTTLKRHT